jgi:hypothetical protein
MTFKAQLSKGRMVEAEHRTTYDYLKKYQDKHGTLPKENKFYEKIATDHIKEDRDYYSKLKRAGL